MDKPPAITYEPASASQRLIEFSALIKIMLPV